MYARNDTESSYEVSTIHSFCLTNIFAPYHWKLPSFYDGYEVLPSDSERFDEFVRDICQHHGLTFNTDIKRAFEQLGRNLDGTPIVSYPLDSKPEAATDFFNQLESHGYIDFTNMIYCSYLLVTRFASIAKSVAYKFSWILLDEFQDTTGLQFEVLKKVGDFEVTKFFLVGDTNQSIYGFAGARPGTMYEFCNLVHARTDFVMNENWRSSQSIVATAERLIPRAAPMVAVGNQSEFTFAPEYHCVDSPYIGIKCRFIPVLKEQNIPWGNSAILAPWWFQLYNLGKKLSQDGIPIVGPGARPYRRSNYLFVRLAEKICEYIETRDAHLVSVLERELFSLVRDLTGEADFRIRAYFSRRIIICIVNEISQATASEDFAETWLKNSVLTIARVLETEQLIQTSHVRYLSESVEELVQEIRDKSVSKLRVKDLALFASYNNNMKLLTFHGAKGLEFDAVALIDLHEGKFPHYTIRDKTGSEYEAMLEESKRLLYVGTTRAKKILMYFTDTSNHKNRPSRFLDLIYPQY